MYLGERVVPDAEGLLGVYRGVQAWVRLATDQVGQCDGGCREIYGLALGLLSKASISLPLWSSLTIFSMILSNIVADTTTSMIT